MQENCEPKYYKARPVPHASREGIARVVEKYVQEGTAWAAPIMPLIK